MKSPCRRARSLDEESCPPFGVPHDVDDYPMHYDPLYYPHYYPSYFDTTLNFCNRLSDTLMIHTQSYSHCQFEFNGLVSYDGAVIFVSQTSVNVSCAIQYFENSSYTH